MRYDISKHTLGVLVERKYGMRPSNGAHMPRSLRKGCRSAKDYGHLWVLTDDGFYSSFGDSGEGLSRQQSRILDILFGSIITYRI